MPPRMHSTSSSMQAAPVAWRSMATYWAVCTLIGSYTGFFASIIRRPHSEPPRALTVAAIIATFAPQPLYCVAVAPSSKRAGRRLSITTILVFATVNAVLETAAFDAAARAGAALVPLSLSSPVASFAAAFAALSVYCGVIHALFWERVFPPHLPPPGTRAAAAMRACLALFGPMTATWCGLLLTGDSGRRAVVGVHWVADAAAAAALRLQGPWIGPVKARRRGG